MIPRSVIWQQYLYGKLVLPSGSIVPNSEHRCIGRSADFPPDLVPLCRPKMDGFGIDINTDWSRYPWREYGGGILSKEVADEVGRTWRIAARICGRAEAGNAREGRIYMQGHFLATPADEWHIGALPALENALERRKEMTEPDMNLPVVETPLTFLDEPLPSDWFDKARQLLKVVSVGNPLSIQDWDQLYLVPFLQTVSYCLALMPSNRGRQMSIGAGVVDMDGSVDIALGMRAIKGPRQVGGVLKGVGQAELKAGLEYADCLEMLCRHAKTLKELLETMQLGRLSQTEAAAHGIKKISLAGDVVASQDADVRPGDWVRNDQGTEGVFVCAQRNLKEGGILKLVVKWAQQQGQDKTQFRLQQMKVAAQWFEKKKDEVYTSPDGGP